jgi:hypothetical protein
MRKRRRKISLKKSRVKRRMENQKNNNKRRIST